jgi:acyl-coenzyme A synthetase/AMP-(fatty) acid ligase
MARNIVVGRALLLGDKRAKIGVVSQAAMRETLIAYGRQNLAAFKVSARWFAAEALPRTATGKLQKHELRASVAQGDFVEF